MQSSLPDFSFPRYLAAKKSVDDRALNRYVITGLRKQIKAWGHSLPFQIIELGAGIGTMIERLYEWDLLPAYTRYVAVDDSKENMAHALTRLQEWGQHKGLAIAQGPVDEFTLSSPGKVTEVRLVCADALELAADRSGQPGFDLLIAHAFLDLLDLSSALSLLLSMLNQGGLFWLTINFDGLTILEPPIDPDYDAYLMRLYHQTMDERLIKDRPSGDSCTGRHLFEHLRRAGGDILRAGSSDWVVFARGEDYPHDEAYFLHFIIHTIETALARHKDLDAARLRDWAANRHDQIRRGELVYIAHQLDLLGRYDRSSRQRL